MRFPVQTALIWQPLMRQGFPRKGAPQLQPLRGQPPQLCNPFVWNCMWSSQHVTRMCNFPKFDPQEAMTV